VAGGGITEWYNFCHHIWCCHSGVVNARSTVITEAWNFCSGSFLLSMLWSSFCRFLMGKPNLQTGLTNSGPGLSPVQSSCHKTLSILAKDSYAGSKWILCMLISAEQWNHTMIFPIWPFFLWAARGDTLRAVYGHLTSKNPNGCSTLDGSYTTPSGEAPRYGWYWKSYGTTQNSMWTQLRI